MFPEKAKLISLLIAALVAGFVVMINVERKIPVWGVANTPVSEHGWPLVYLLRQSDEDAPAETLENSIPSRWPWPVDKKELRTFSSTNLTTDIIVGTSIVLVVYMMTHTVLRQFLSSTPSESKSNN